MCVHMCVHFWYPSIDLILSCKGNQPEPLNFHSLCCINPKVFLGDTLLVCKQVLNVSPRCPLASKRNLVRWKGMNPYEVIPPIPQCCNQNICLCAERAIFLLPIDILWRKSLFWTIPSHAP